MKDIDKYKLIWENLVEDIYIQNEEFDYIKSKAIFKRINVFYNNLLHKKRDILTTFDLTNFNEKEEVKKNLEELLEYIEDMSSFLGNFIELKPTTKKAYYNYIKSIIAYL